MKNNLAILVLSCDKYEYLWDNFFESLWRFFPNNLNVYLSTNRKIYHDSKVKTINTNRNSDWSDELIEALNQIEEENVFIFLEDAPLTKELNQVELFNLYNEYIEKNWNYIGMKGTPASHSIPGRTDIGEIKKGDFYRASLIFAIWKKKTLIDLLTRGESAWEFEVNGTIRSDKYDNFYCTKETLIDYEHLLIKGEFNWRLRKKYTALINKYKIKEMSLSRWIMHEIHKNVMNSLLKLLPPNKRRGLKGLKDKLLRRQI